MSNIIVMKLITINAHSRLVILGSDVYYAFSHPHTHVYMVMLHNTFTSMFHTRAQYIYPNIVTEHNLLINHFNHTIKLFSLANNRK